MSKVMFEGILAFLMLVSVHFMWCSSASSDISALNSILKAYDLLNEHNFKHHVSKRDLYRKHPNEKKVEYDSLGRHFKLVLKKEYSILANDFKVLAIDKNNNQRQVDINPNLYRGYLEDEPSKSSVSAYYDDDGTITAAIRTDNDVYVIEPSVRHLPDMKNVTMISYRRSDINMIKDFGENFCAYEKIDDVDQETKVDFADEDINEGKKRKKRQLDSCSTGGKTACSLLLVADYRFHNSIGLNDIAKTTRYLIGLMDYIDSIYQSHHFGSCETMGFVIKEIRIHEHPTSEPVKDKRMRFNVDQTDWDNTKLLQVFSSDESFQNYCLAHLFTHIAFSNGVLGLAYIGSSRPYSVGGICSPSYYKDGEELYLNSGWSSSLNRYGRKLLTEELRLVSAHEFGHNWGSEHDPDSTECSPSASSGGKYIMYTYSVSGMDANNKIFSPCSRRAIEKVLQAKAASCFTKPTHGFCGNFRVERENGEECDAGAVDENNPDPCCNSKCQLIRPAKCSDKNSVCCDHCQFASTNKICYSETELLCEGEQRCNGREAECPKPPPKPDGSKCFNSGKCRNGSCMSYCEYNGNVSCVCDQVAESCKWCCKDRVEGNSTCRPFSSHLSAHDDNLPDGMPCIQGICEKGVCLKQVNNTIQRLWNIIENININQLVMFMRANIVGTVIVLSLIIWIPASCIVAYVDRKRAKEQQEEQEWFNPDSKAMFLDRENIKVVNAKSVKRRKNVM